MDAIDEFLQAITPRLVELVGDGTDRVDLVAVRDRTGDVATPVTPESMPPRSMLASLIENGAAAAASITFLPGRAEIVAHVYLGEAGALQREDIRRAFVTTTRRGLSVSPWRPAA